MLTGFCWTISRKFSQYLAYVSVQVCVYMTGQHDCLHEQREQVPCVRVNLSGLYFFPDRDFLPRGSGIVTRRPLILQLLNANSGRSDTPI